MKYSLIYIFFILQNWTYLFSFWFWKFHLVFEYFIYFFQILLALLKRIWIFEWRWEREVFPCVVLTGIRIYKFHLSIFNLLKEFVMIVEERMWIITQIRSCIRVDSIFKGWINNSKNFSESFEFEVQISLFLPVFVASNSVMIATTIGFTKNQFFIRIAFKCGS